MTTYRKGTILEMFLLVLITYVGNIIYKLYLEADDTLLGFAVLNMRLDGPFQVLLHYY